MTTRLTVPQIQGVRYYQRLALPTNLRRLAPKVDVPDPRVLQVLIDLKLIELDRHDHGPIFRITEEGRALKVQATLRMPGHVMDGQTVLVMRQDPAGLHVTVQVLNSRANYRRGDNLKLQPNQVVMT